MKKGLSVLLLTSFFSLTCCKPTNITFTMNELESPIEVHTELQLNNFINKTFDEIKSNTYYATGQARKTDCSAPAPIRISWKAKADKGKIDGYNVLISENEDFTNPFEFSSTKSYFDFYNAKLNTKYYCKVASCGFESEVMSFTTTNKGPRNIYVDGVRNVRDLGGYGYIKQGMLYRGGAFESMDEDTHKVTVNITKKGKDTVRNVLKIKTEVDVRKNLSESGWIENCQLESSTVEGVNYVALPMYYGGQNVLTYKDDNYDDPAAIKQFFSILAKEDSYPVYFHCSHGKDRTGGLAYVVEALLGMDEESMFRDYLFSNFASAMDYHMVPTGITGNFGKTLAEYEQEDTTLSLAQRTYDYLKNVVGISTTDLDLTISLLSA